MNQISDSDSRLRQPNTLCKRLTCKPAEISFDGETIGIGLSQYFPDEGLATVILKPADMLKLLRKNPFSMVCLPNAPDGSAIPTTCQRIPVKERRNVTRGGWVNKDRYPDNKVETIDVSVFGAKVEPARGLVLDSNSLMIVVDGGGRVCSAEDEIEDGTTAIEDRNILWQLNVDASSNYKAALQRFLLANRFAKHALKGTTMTVTNSLLTEKKLSGEPLKFDDINDPLARTWVVRMLYDGEIRGNLLELFPWKYEGQKAESNDFKGKGSAGSLETTLTDLAKLINYTGVKVKDLPKVLGFAFDQWYSACPKAVNDAREAAFGNEHKARLYSTLALKIIVLISLRVWAEVGDNPKRFVQMCEAVVGDHFSHYKRERYLNSKSRTMNMDRFWFECKWVADEFFNSGAGNTAKVMNEIRICCNSVCGPEKNRRSKSKKEAN